MKGFIRVVGLNAALALAFSSAAVAQEWATDMSHSSVNFEVSHLVVSTITGAFTEFDGKIANFDGVDLTKATVSFTVQTTSINTHNENRDKHLRTGDFFLVDSFPTLTFVSSTVATSDGKKFQLSGAFTMRGVTKDVSFDCVYRGAIKNPFDKQGSRKAGFTAKATINRQDFGVSYGSVLEGGGLAVGNDVDITLQLEMNEKLPPPASPASPSGGK